MIADSRVPNLRLVGKHLPGVPRLLLRMPAQKQAEDVVMHTEYSLNSSLMTLKALSDAAVKLGKVHKPIIMVDVGDLREGVWPENLVPPSSKKLPCCLGLTWSVWAQTWHVMGGRYSQCGEYANPDRRTG